MEVTQRTNGGRELAKGQNGIHQNHSMILWIFKKMRAHRSAQSLLIPMMGGGCVIVLYPIKKECRLSYAVSDGYIV